MSREENKILSQKASLIWNTKAFEKLSELYASDCIYHQQEKHANYTFTGIEAFRKWMEEFFNKYPDYQERIVEQMVDGNKVINVIEGYTSKANWSGVFIDRIEQDKIQETWVWFKHL